MLPATTGPLPLIEPPCAGTPFTVGNSGAVSKSHRILPSADEYARRCPSMAPENTTPGIAVTAASCPRAYPRTAFLEAWSSTEASRCEYQWLPDHQAAGELHRTM